MSTVGQDREARRIREAYGRRLTTYDPVEPWVLYTRQERERALARWMRDDLPAPASELRLLELGCGAGANLADFIRLGLAPDNLWGIDLLEDRIRQARARLPDAVHLAVGDAGIAGDRERVFHVVFQSMMCSSILDDFVLDRVTRRMWELTQPGGGVLWYDFCYDNPRNPDVRGLPLSRVRALFPAPVAWSRRVTLAPPVSRVATRLYPSLYTIFNSIPLLRTHRLCWIPKPAGPRPLGRT